MRLIQMCEKSKSQLSRGSSSHKVSTKERYDPPPREIHKDMVKIIAADLPSSEPQKSSGTGSTQKMTRGHPKISTTDKQNYVIPCIVLDKRHLTVDQMANSIGISTGSVHTVLSEILKMNELSSRWVPRKQTPKHKLDWNFQTLLTGFQTNL